MKRVLTIIMLLGTTHLIAQTYPITGLNISMPANPDANTANWGQGASPFSIGAQTKLDSNRQVNPFVMETKILVTIKKGGAKVCGTYTNANAPASNFNSAFKVWNGRNGVSLLGQDCVLPPGEYELCVQFFGNRNGLLTAFSDERCKIFSIAGTPTADNTSYQPPQNIAPAEGTVIKEADAKKPITFRWTPVVPRPRDPVTYRLKVWQLMQGQNGTAAMRSNQPIVTKDVDNITQAVMTNIYTGPCRPPYLCEFVWNVQALNKDGNPVGKNNGTSEQWSFSIKETNPANPPAPQAIMAGANAEFKIDSAVCLPKQNGLFKYHIWGHYRNMVSSSNSILLNDALNFTGYPANPNPGPGTNLRNNIRMKSGTYNGALTMSDILEASSGTISNINPLPASIFTPASLVPNSTHNFQFDYTTATNTAVQFTYYGLVDDALKFNANRNSRNEIDSLKYPTCPCSACDDVTINIGMQGNITNNGNGGLNFTALVASAPKKVKRIRAELVYFDMKPENENCISCNKNDNYFGNFMNAAATNSNFTSVIPQPHSAQLDASGDININAGVPINFTVSIPPMVSCCNADVNFCIRYVITYEDCTVCNKLVCYNYKITGCQK